MEADFRFEPVTALAVVAGGALLSLLAGLAFALPPARRAARAHPARAGVTRRAPLAFRRPWA